MKAKKLFLWLVLLLFLLIGRSIFLIFQEQEYLPIFLENKSVKTPIAKPLVRTVEEGQSDLNLLLSSCPLSFDDNSSSFDLNQSENQERLAILLLILESIDEDIALTVVSHSNSDGSRSYNRKRTQKRADTLAQYIREHYSASYINSIGYGEEYPLTLDKNSTRSNERIEIYLQRIIAEKPPEGNHSKN